MINKRYRLKKNFQFSYIYRHGKSEKGKNLVLIYTPSKYQSIKIGFSVGKNVGKSVVRSLVKRRLTECFNSLVEAFPKKYNYIVVARDSAKDATFHELKAELEKLVMKINSEIN